MLTIYGVMHSMMADGSEVPENNMQNMMHRSLNKANAEAAMIADSIRQDLEDCDPEGEYGPYSIDKAESMDGGLCRFEIVNGKGYTTDIVAVVEHELESY